MSTSASGRNIETLTEWMQRQVRVIQRIMDCGTDTALADALRAVYMTGYNNGLAAASKKETDHDGP